MSKFKAELTEYVNAVFSGLWIHSYEHGPAIDEIRAIARAQPLEWGVQFWDADYGLINEEFKASAMTPVDAVKSLRQFGTNNHKFQLLVMKNLHMFINNPQLIQVLANQIDQGKKTRTFVIALCPTVKIPMELEKHFQVLTHPLPNRDQLEKLAERTSTKPTDFPENKELRTGVLDAASGLTSHEAESAFCLSLIRKDKLESNTVWEIKKSSIAQSGIMTIHEGKETFSDICGLEGIKKFIQRSMANRNPKASPRGILNLGLPGVGKSLLAKALGNELNIPTVSIDVGRLMGGHVGDTERNTRELFERLDKFGRVVAWIDEIEKMLSGAGGDGSTDSGVMARLGGSFLTHLSERTSQVYFIATANDIQTLINFSGGAFVRAGRWDAIFYTDLPSKESKEQAWKLYTKYFELKTQKTPPDTGWTPAEIKQCCMIACQQGIPLEEAGNMIVPVSSTAAEQIERLRGWADGKVLSSETGHVYTRSGPVSMPTETARAVNRVKN